MQFKSLTILAAMLGLSATGSAQVIINEVMQSNIDCIMDDIHEFPDSWVELYNSGTSTENLKNYSINDKDKPKKAFTLPDYNLAPGQYYIVYCDKEETGRHASFRLETTKDGSLYLYKNSKVADKIEVLAKQPAPNVAYGRKSDGSAEWGYMLTPTPGATNAGGIVAADHLLPDPVFSHTGQVTSTPFDLTLSLPEGAPQGAVIRFTTDGSEPKPTSRLYTSPVHIGSTTTVRAKLFATGYLTNRSLTQSYIFHGRDFTIPVVSMVTDKDYFFGSANGIYNHYEEDWRRPINLELFMEENAPGVLNQLCETRIKGGATRSAALKSLALYANKRFGQKRFEYEFFPEDMPGLTDWSSFELRNSGNDFDYTYFRDALIQRIMGRGCDLDWQPYRPAVFYLNGEYKGMLNIRPRSNEDLISVTYNGLEDIDMIENNWELKEGTADSWYAFQEFYAAHGHTFAEFDALMDCQEFANLYIMNLVFDNKDFPANNIVCWRPIADGGRWRWVAKDTDFGLGLYDKPYEYKTFNWLYTPGYDPNHDWGNTSDGTRLFRRLMEIPEFKEMFIERTAVYMGDFLTEVKVKAEIDKMYDDIKYEYKYHRALFNQWWPNHADEVNKMKTWITGRIPYFYRHMAEYFGLGTPKPMQIDMGRVDDIKLNINGVELVNRGFNGKYFEGRPLKIQAAQPEAVSAWEVTVVNAGTTTKTTYQGSVLDITMPSCTFMSIQSVAAPSGINDVTSDTIDPTDPIEVFSLMGVSMGTYPTIYDAQNTLRGLYIIRQGNKTEKRVF